MEYQSLQKRKEDFIGKKIEDRKDRIKDFHWLENTVLLDGELLRVGVQIAEDDFGNLFYNLNQDLDFWNKKYKSSNGTPTQSTIGSKRGLQDVNTSIENSINNLDEDVNLTVSDEKTLLFQSDPTYTNAEQKLQEDVKAWKEAVDNIIKQDKVPSQPVKMLQQTPLVMELISADTLTGKHASSNGVFVSPHVFDGSHTNITSNMLKQIPKAMADPIAIFDSETNRKNGDIVFMLDIKDNNGATMVLPVVLSTRGKIGRTINILKTAYTKESNTRPNNGWLGNKYKKMLVT